MAFKYQITNDIIFNAIIVLNESLYFTSTKVAKAHNIAPRTIQQRLQKIG